MNSTSASASASRTDWALLRRYVESNSQDAFAALVSRHLNMVYTTCFRELRDTTLAEDAAQSVFIILAAKAPKLSARTHLAGWLFQTARFAAKNARTRQTRRERHEIEVMRQATRTRSDQEQPTWDDAEPLINQAVAKLSPAEREAILLRYWDNLRIAEVGAFLGVSEEAARKRITRALARLRVQLERQGVALGTAALAAALSAKAARSAPQALAPSIARITLHTANAGLVNLGLTAPAAQQISKGMLKAMKIAQLKTIGAVAAATVVVGGAAVKIVQGHPVPNPKIELGTPTNGQDQENIKYFPPPAPADAYRNVLLTGRLVYENGKPAAGVAVAAQVQNSALEQWDEHYINPKSRTPIIPPKQEQEQSWNNAITRADGTYTLPVGDGVPYNVMAFDSTGKWVASAVQGIKGDKGLTVRTGDMVFTQGAIIEGTETNAKGQPITPNTPVKLGSGQIAKGSEVAVIDQARPSSSAGVSSVRVDGTGHYRLRVTPGVCRVYVMENGANHPSSDKTVTVAAGEIKTVNLQVP